MNTLKIGNHKCLLLEINCFAKTSIAIYTNVKKGEVGMALPKDTQTRVVGIITYKVHPKPTLAFCIMVQCHVYMSLSILTCKASYFSLPTAYHWAY